MSWLGRLGQGVEIARLHTTGYEEVARALRRALDKDGSLDFEEAVVVQVVADVLHGAMAQPEVFLHGGPAEVEVAVTQAQALVGFNVVGDVERGSLRLVEYRDAVGHHLDLASGKRWVLGTFGPFLDRPYDLYAPLGAEAFARWRSRRATGSRG